MQKKPSESEQINPFFVRLELAHRGWALDRAAHALGYGTKARTWLSRLLNYQQDVGKLMCRQFVATFGDDVRGLRDDTLLHIAWDDAGRPPVLAWYKKVTGHAWPTRPSVKNQVERAINIIERVEADAKAAGKTLPPIAAPIRPTPSGRIAIAPALQRERERLRAAG